MGRRPCRRGASQAVHGTALRRRLLHSVRLTAPLGTTLLATRRELGRRHQLNRLSMGRGAKSIPLLSPTVCSWTSNSPKYHFFRSPGNNLPPLHVMPL